jgi:hypothetical protein
MRLVLLAAVLVALTLASSASAARDPLAAYGKPTQTWHRVVSGRIVFECENWQFTRRGEPPWFVERCVMVARLHAPARKPPTTTGPGA